MMEFEESIFEIPEQVELLLPVDVAALDAHPEVVRVSESQSQEHRCPSQV
jgi:hypothetical protein